VGTIFQISPHYSGAIVLMNLRDDVLNREPSFYSAADLELLVRDFFLESGSECGFFIAF
jgi:hypothetical protein